MATTITDSDGHQPPSNAPNPSSRRRQPTWFDGLLVTVIAGALIGGGIMFASHLQAVKQPNGDIAVRIAGANSQPYTTPSVPDPPPPAAQTQLSSCPTLDPAAAEADQIAALLNIEVYAVAHSDQACQSRNNFDAQSRPVPIYLQPDIGTGAVTVLACQPYGQTGETDIQYTSGGVYYNAHATLVHRADGGLLFYDLPSFTNETPVTYPPGPCDLTTDDPNTSTLSG